MTLVLGGSILAAFFAGSVALFSPCCIVFLFPAYLASAVKDRRWALFPLTVVFAAGLAVVILPLTLGMGLLAETLARYHTPLYLVGGAMMIGLGVLAVGGRSWRIPMRSPRLDRGDAPGVFALGVFSGVASSCCAPVLAGVMTLSALAGSLPGSVALGLAYVFGMVFPLFLLALLWDRLRLGERRPIVGRPLTVWLGSRRLHTTTTNAIAGVVFLAMGAAVIWLALSGNPMAAPGSQLGIGRFLSGIFGGIVRATRSVPEPVLGLLVLAIAVVIWRIGRRWSRRSAPATKEVRHASEEEPSPSATPVG